MTTYSVTFMTIEGIEAETDHEAIEAAAQAIIDDPEFYVSAVVPNEDDKAPA